MASKDNFEYQDSTGNTKIAEDKTVYEYLWILIHKHLPDAVYYKCPDFTKCKER